jgi:thiol-disulfide isomerase/thioredoxin
LVALAWNDLVRRAEARPAACTVNKEYKFQNGAIVRAGTKVTILDVKPTSLLVGTPDGRIRFDVKPEETDVLAVANAAWAQLTPAQRDLTFAALLQRMDLWPYLLNLTAGIRLEGQTLAAGEPVQFLGFEGDQPLVRHTASGVLFNAEMNQIDLMARARALVASEAGAPGRMLEELAAAKLVSAVTGQPAAVDLNARPKYVVLYRGAGWCGPCQIFSPSLVKLLKEKAPKSTDVALFYISADKSPAEAKAYVTKIGIDWPTIYYQRTDQLPAFHKLIGDAIPQLLVTDRHGKVLVDSAKVGTARALQQLGQLL